MASTSPPPFSHIVICGAGPAGLLLSLLLTQSHHSLRVTILEANHHLDTRLRATQYGTPAVRVLRQAGVLDDIRTAGLWLRNINWRRSDTGEVLVSLNGNLTKDHPDRVAVLHLSKLLIVLKEHVDKRSNIEIKWGHRVVKVGQDEDKRNAWVEVEIVPPPSSESLPCDRESAPLERRSIEGDFVVDSSGAKSPIRRALFGSEEASFPGFTWPQAVISCNITYAGFRENGWDDANYLIGEHWGMVSRRNNDGLWRVTYGDKGGLPEEEYVKRRGWKFENLLPGHPKPEDYVVSGFDLFKVHNRCVPHMRVGRILFIGDAAHLCTPFGGWGLTNGIVDVGELSRVLLGIYDRRCQEDILDIWDEVRRGIFARYVDKRSSRNMKRMIELNPDGPGGAVGGDQFMAFLKDLESKPEESRAFQLKVSKIEHDFTQYFTK